MEREITITVTDDEARLIEERVSAGEYNSAADYVHATVSTALSEAAFDIPGNVLRLLLEEDDADTSPDVDIDEAFAEVYRHIDELAAKRDGKS